MSHFATRFAPSPTGKLHLGHAFSALLCARAAERAGTRLILRIEDIDQGRCKPEFETAIFEDLAWLGLDWEKPVRRQSDHFHDYTTALEKLIDLGVVYRCFKTRREVAAEIARAPHLSANGPDGPQYIGAPLAPQEEETLLAEGKAYAWRLSVRDAKSYVLAKDRPLAFRRATILEDGELSTDPTPIQARPEIFGDPVLARKDFGTSYHMASVWDDAHQGITHVIRGEDLAATAHLHTLLQALLDLPPVIYAHHRLITDENGVRLAKRDQSKTLASLRAAGVTPTDILHKY